MNARPASFAPAATDLDLICFAAGLTAEDREEMLFGTLTVELPMKPLNYSGPMNRIHIFAEGHEVYVLLSDPAGIEMVAYAVADEDVYASPVYRSEVAPDGE